MSEESTTPDLLERWRVSFEAGRSGDYDAAMTIWGPDPVWDTSPLGLGVYEGVAAIREFWEDWIGTYRGYAVEAEEMLDLGSGVTFAVIVQSGSPPGSSRELRLRYAAIAEWAEGGVVRITNYTDIDEARAAAERLAEERG
jgi:ketosteroid isomerase-like protein